MHNSFNLAMNAFIKYRLAWPLAISLLLHAIALSQISWKALPSPAIDQSRLTVSIASPPARPEKIFPDSKLLSASTDNNGIKKIVEENNTTEQTSSSPPETEPSHLAETNTIVAHLDTNKLLNQVREYASKEFRTTTPAFILNGDYYGTYTGSDSGTFYVHLDSAGHASGSGQSGTFGISFIITGDATKEGFIQMSGTGIAGTARFKGQLNIKTGQVSGSWIAASIGSGTFSGQHE
jgi:hypothetical protein